MAADRHIAGRDCWLRRLGSRPCQALDRQDSVELFKIGRDASHRSRHRVQPTTDQELRLGIARLDQLITQAERLDQCKALRTAGQQRLGPDIEPYPVEDSRIDLAAPPAAGLQNGHLQSGSGQGPSSHEPRNSATDHRDACAHATIPSALAARRSSTASACTISTIRASTSGSASGGTPWPRLKTWPGAAAPDLMISRTRSASTDQGAPSSAGSRLPWTAYRSPIRWLASANGTRQSTPTTSAPASAIEPSSSPVPTPK